ncbi:MAG: hypothetical protein ACREN6_10945 [Gemmatimonadaceae bacterium]
MAGSQRVVRANPGGTLIVPHAFALETRRPETPNISKSVRRSDITADSLAAWSKLLDKIAKMSKRGERAVELRRTLLYALAAPSDEIFHLRLSKLPVTVTDSLGEESGRSGYFRNYAVRGVTRARYFVPANAKERSRAKLGTSGWFEGEGEPLPSLQLEGSVSTGPNRSGATDCSMTSPYDGLYYEGDCATQEDIDDGYAEIASMDDEINGDYDEAVDDCNASPDPSQCTATDETAGSGLPERAATTFGLEMLEDGSDGYSMLPSVGLISAERGCSSAPSLSSSGLLSDTRNHCFQQAIDAAAGVAGWGLAKYGAYLVLTAEVDPPVGAVVAAVGGSILVGWGFVSSVSTYMGCVRAT